MTLNPRMMERLPSGPGHRSMGWHHDDFIGPRAAIMVTSSVAVMVTFSGPGAARHGGAMNTPKMIG